MAEMIAMAVLSVVISWAALRVAAREERKDEREGKP